MEKSKKIKFAITSVVVVIVLAIGGLLSFFLLRKKDDFSNLLANVGDKLEQNNNNLVNSYNSSNSATAATFSCSGEQKATLVSDSDTASIQKGEETFSNYIQNANLVIGYYAICEYLNEHLNPLKLGKTYYYKSSTVQYYAVAFQTDNSFSFVLHNDNEDISVVVVHENNEPKSVTFTSRQKSTENYKFLNAVIDFTKNTYNQISYTCDTDNLLHSFEESNLSTLLDSFASFSVDYNDYSKYDGIVASSLVGLGENLLKNITSLLNKYAKFDVLETIKDKLSLTSPINFPQPEDLQNYAFNKYIVSLEESSDGTLMLSTKQRKGMNSKVYEALTTFQNKFSNSAVPEQFSALSYTSTNNDLNAIISTVFGGSIKKTPSDILPDFTSFMSTVTSWLTNKYNKNTFYYKSEQLNGFDFYVGTNNLIILKQTETSLDFMIVTDQNSSFYIEYFTINETNTTSYNLLYSDFNGEKSQSVTESSLMSIEKNVFNKTYTQIKNSIENNESVPMSKPDYSIELRYNLNRNTNSKEWFNINYDLKVIPSGSENGYSFSISKNNGGAEITSYGSLDKQINYFARIKYALYKSYNITEFSTAGKTEINVNGSIDIENNFNNNNPGDIIIETNPGLTNPDAEDGSSIELTQTTNTFEYLSSYNLTDNVLLWEYKENIVVVGQQLILNGDAMYFDENTKTWENTPDISLNKNVRTYDISTVLDASIKTINLKLTFIIDGVIYVLTTDVFNF